MTSAAWVFLIYTMLANPFDASEHAVAAARRSATYDSWMDCERASGTLVLADQLTARSTGRPERLLVTPCDLMLVDGYAK